MSLMLGTTPVPRVSVLATGGGGSGGNLQTKTKSYTPTETAQSETVRADAGYDGLSQVSISVGAVDPTYVGTQVPRISTATITPGTSDQTLSSGSYLSGTQTIKGDANLVAINIKKDISLFGVTGSYEGGAVVKEFGVRGDAELIQTYSADELLVEDLETAIPAYTTSAKTIITGASLTPTITLDYANYNYYVVMRSITIPIYNTTTKQKGRCDYTTNAYNYEVVDVPANSIQTIDRAKTINTSRSISVTSLGSVGREIYWTSASAVTFVTNSTYGAQCTGQAPAVSSGVMTVKAPNYGIRGSTTYMTSGAWGTMTDIRYQWVIEVWRVPKGKAADGWQFTQNLIHTFADVRKDGKLT